MCVEVKKEYEVERRRGRRKVVLGGWYKGEVASNACHGC